MDIKRLNDNFTIGNIADKKIYTQILNQLNDEQLKTFLSIAEQMKSGESKKFTVLRDDYIPKDKRRFIKVYVKETAELIREAKSLNDLKVLTTMIEKMNFDNGEIFITNVALGEILNMKPQLVGRSIKNLIKEGYILIKDENENKKTKTYILNEKYFKYGR